MSIRGLILPGLMLIAVGCGGGDSSSTTVPAGTAEPGTVEMGEFFYAPVTITVRAGGTVTFRNAGKIAHTIADVDSAGEVRSQVIKPQELAPGASQTVRFPAPGMYDYICTFHPKLMDGTVIVTS